VFVSIFNPASQPHRARFALNPVQMMTMFGHKVPVKGDRLDIASQRGMVRLTANPKGRFALSNAHSIRRPGFVTILASEVGMGIIKGSAEAPATAARKTLTAVIPTELQGKTLASSALRPKVQKVKATKTPVKKAKPKAKATAKKAIAKKSVAPRRPMKMLGSIMKPKTAKKAAAPRSIKGTGVIPALSQRPATTMLGDAVAKLNKILAVTKNVTVTTKNNRVLVTAERTIIVSYT
jgi:hypothetical protein